jgi:hypothetical protein
LNTESKTPLHYQVVFSFAPGPELSPANVLKYLQQLAQAPRGISFQETRHAERSLTFLRVAPPLTVQIGSWQGALDITKGPSTSFLDIEAVHPSGEQSEFCDSARDVLAAYGEVWGVPIQFVQRECIVRYLFEVQQSHAFQYLWEQRLHQRVEELSAFKRPILGGGLRFVMPARDRVNEPLYDVKIESFLSNPKQLFVELHATWGPSLSTADDDPMAIFQTTTDYVSGSVMAFLTSET